MRRLRGIPKEVLCRTGTGYLGVGGQVGGSRGWEKRRFGSMESFIPSFDDGDRR